MGVTDASPSLRLHPSMLNSAVRIVVVGAGGTGSQVLYCLAQLDMAMRALGHPGGLEVTVIDSDQVSEANIGRQLFFACDVGMNKAAVLIHRINLTFGTNWTARPTRLVSSGQIGRETTLVIGCVDNRLARAVISTWFSQDTYSSCAYWLDFGNKVDSGQAILGYSEKGKVIVPSCAELFPDIVDPNVQDPDEGPSCSLAEALEKQSLFINRTVATHGMNLLWELFHHGQVDHHGAFVHLRNGRVMPLKVDPEAWARMGYKPRVRKPRKKPSTEQKAA